MTHPILAQLLLWPEPDLTCGEPGKQGDFINLHTAWSHPEYLPPYITRSATILRILDLIGPLDWAHFPERDLKHTFGFPPIPYAALVAATLIQLNEHHRSLKQLHLFLGEHPGFISLLEGWTRGNPIPFFATGTRHGADASAPKTESGRCRDSVQSWEDLPLLKCDCPISCLDQEILP